MCPKPQAQAGKGFTAEKITKKYYFHNHKSIIKRGLTAKK